MGNDNAITLGTIIQQNDKKFLANSLGEEMVMMNMENGDFISMNKVGADIWNLSRQPLSVNELIQQLLKLYDISEPECIFETVQFLEASAAQEIFTFKNADNA
jgi:coenzyme PQQ synthesis protein D (PqqD)